MIQKEKPNYVLQRTICKREKDDKQISISKISISSIFASTIHVAESQPNLNVRKQEKR